MIFDEHSNKQSYSWNHFFLQKPLLSNILHCVRGFQELVPGELGAGVFPTGANNIRTEERERKYTIPLCVYVAVHVGVCAV